jgi:drug/metabolite transporter (DMT)-like permease
MIERAPVRAKYIADFSLLLVTLAWGLSFTILKSIIGEQFSPVFFVMIRFVLASAVAYPFCRRKLRNLDRGGFIGGIILGGLIFFGFTTQSMGIQFTTASKSAFITGLAVLFIPLFLLAHKRKSPGMINVMAIIVALAGMYLLTGPAGGTFNRGDFLTLLCASAFGAQIYVMGIVAPGRDFASITFVELATTAALAALFLPFEDVKFIFSSLSILAILFLGIVATAGALLVQTWAQQRTSAVKTGLIFTAEPVFAYMFASFLLGDYFNPVQKTGGAIIVAAVIMAEVLPLLISRKRRRT